MKEKTRITRALLAVNYRAIVVAAALALVASAVYYIVLSPLWLEFRGLPPGAAASTRPQVWEMLGQYARNVIVAYVLARLLVRLEVVDWKGALRLGIWVWIGFEAMAIAGSVLHEGYPWRLYLIHVGDALMSTLLMAAVIGVWHAKRSSQLRKAGIAASPQVEA